MKILKIIAKDLLSILDRIICNFPTTTIFNSFRKFYFENFHNFKKIDRIHAGIKIPCKKNITCGENLICANDVEINSCDSLGIYIGKNVVFGPNVYIRAANHDPENPELPLVKKKHIYKKIDYKQKEYSIVIEDNVWVGAKTIILTGAFIKNSSVIGAGSIVNKDNYPEKSLIAGNPAKVIKNL